MKVVVLYPVAGGVCRGGRNPYRATLRPELRETAFTAAHIRYTRLLA